MPIILESPTPPSPSPAVGVSRESLILDGLDLNDGGIRTLVGFEFTAAKKILELIKGADSDGSKLLRLARHENSEFDLKLLIRNSTRNTVLDAIGGIIDKLQEAERQAAGGLGRGLPLVWSPMGSTYTYTAYVLTGESNLLRAEDFYKLGKPYIDLKLICHPFLYGPEVTTATTTSSLPLITMTIADVPGDVPAELRIIVTDAAGQSRDYVCVGLENFYYDAGTALLTDSASFVTSGFAGTTTTRTGAYSSDGVVRATLTTTPVAVCSSAELTHKGTFRNLFRLWPSSTTVSVRLAWRQGRDQWTTEPWVQAPFEDAFWEVDLGQSKIRQALLGTQTWQWRLEAKSTAAGDTIDADFHALIPSGEGYGKARRTVTYDTPTVFTARDEFDQTAGALTGKSLPVGGTWTVFGGDTDDFVVDATTKTAQRATLADTTMPTSTELGRAVSVGTTALAAVVAQVDFHHTALVGCVSGLLLRAADTSNYTTFQVRAPGTVDGAIHQIKLAGGVQSNLLDLFQTGRYSFIANTWYSLRVLIDTAGRWFIWFFPWGGSAGQPLASGQDSAFATGGALASGKFGIYDRSGSNPCTRSYDNFHVFVPTADAALFASQSLEYRSYGDNPVLRKDAGGQYWGQPGEARGGRLWLPPAGEEDRTTRIAVLARRNDIETQPNSSVTDSTSVAVSYRSRWINVPRQA